MFFNPLFFSIAEWMYVTEWSTCSATCGGGILTRTQSCVYSDNTTAHGVCSGSATTETQNCNTIQCRKLLLRTGDSDGAGILGI